MKKLSRILVVSAVLVASSSFALAAPAKPASSKSITTATFDNIRQQINARNSAMLSGIYQRGDKSDPLKISDRLKVVKKEGRTKDGGRISVTAHFTKKGHSFRVINLYTSSMKLVSQLIERKFPGVGWEPVQGTIPHLNDGNKTGVVSYLYSEAGKWIGSASTGYKGGPTVSLVVTDKDGVTTELMHSTNSGKYQLIVSKSGKDGYGVTPQDIPKKDVPKLVRNMLKVQQEQFASSKHSAVATTSLIARSGAQQHMPEKYMQSDQDQEEAAAMIRQRSMRARQRTEDDGTRPTNTHQTGSFWR